MAPTTADLIEALRKPGESYEDLAARLPISLSTVNRWKKESPQDWEGLLRMLEMAGWLVPPEGARPLLEGEAAEIRALRDEMASLLKRLLELTGQ